jgi:hypothetical protein
MVSLGEVDGFIYLGILRRTGAARISGSIEDASFLGRQPFKVHQQPRSSHPNRSGVFR